MIKELENDIVVFTLNKNLNIFPKKILKYLKLNKKDIIIFFKYFSYKKLIENLIELNSFQNSINRVMVIVPSIKNEVNSHNDLNLIKSIEEGIDYIMFEKIQREL